MSIFAVTWANQVNNLLPPITRARDFIAVPDAVGSKFSCGLPLSMYLEFIVMSSPGHWKEKPGVGVNLWLWMQSSQSPQQLKRIIVMQLTGDIFQNPLVDVSKFPTVIVNDLKFEPQ